jgi:hypothetical protein
MIDPATILLALGGASGITMIVRQIRIGLRDRGDRHLLRHIYDQDRQAKVLETLQDLRRTEARVLDRMSPKAQDHHPSKQIDAGRGSAPAD